MPVARPEQRKPQSFPYGSPPCFEMLRFAGSRCQVGYLDSGFEPRPFGTADSVTDLLPQLPYDRAAPGTGIQDPLECFAPFQNKTKAIPRSPVPSKNNDPIQALWRVVHRDFACPLLLANCAPNLIYRSINDLHGYYFCDAQ